MTSQVSHVNTEQIFIAKEHIATHTNLILAVKPSLFNDKNF